MSSLSCVKSSMNQQEKQIGHCFLKDCRYFFPSSQHRLFETDDLHWIWITPSFSMHHLTCKLHLEPPHVSLHLVEKSAPRGWTLVIKCGSTDAGVIVSLVWWCEWKPFFFLLFFSPLTTIFSLLRVSHWSFFPSSLFRFLFLFLFSHLFLHSVQAQK